MIIESDLQRLYKMEFLYIDVKLDAEVMINN